MKLAFYKVDNSQDFARHTFDGMEGEEIGRMLSRLSDEELRVYDTENNDDMVYLVEDFNDEILDNGWWCIEIY